MTKKKNEKKVAVVAKKVEMVNIFKTTYYYWRFWIKEILKTGKISKSRFVKDEIGYTGNIAVQKTEVDNAKNILISYKSQNRDTVDMWW